MQGYAIIMTKIFKTKQINIGVGGIVEKKEVHH